MARFDAEENVRYYSIWTKVFALWERLIIPIWWTSSYQLSLENYQVEVAISDEMR